MSTVTEAVKESLVGSPSSEQPQLSHQIKANFHQHARKDDQTGELYMTEEEFTNAVAPKQEDYVSLSPAVANEFGGASGAGGLTSNFLLAA